MSNNAMNYLLSLVLLGFSVSSVRHVFRSWKTMTNVPKSMKWAGARDEIFPYLQVCAREFVAGLRTLKIGYDKVG